MHPGATGAGRFRALEVALATTLLWSLALAMGAMGGCRPNPPADALPTDEAALRAAIAEDRARVAAWVATSSPEEDRTTEAGSPKPDPEIAALGQHLADLQRALNEITAREPSSPRAPIERIE